MESKKERKREKDAREERKERKASERGLWPVDGGGRGERGDARARKQEKDAHAPQEAEIKKCEHRPEEKIADSESVSARPAYEDGGDGGAPMSLARAVHHKKRKNKARARCTTSE